jgi:hypothetical protein
MKVRTIALNAVLAAATLITTPMPVQAQRRDTCDELWQRRNSIYASHGYCFQSRRAIAVFGRGCFPPYGRMAPDAAREVARLQSEERRRRCPA